MTSPLVLWPSLAGLVFLLIGLIGARTQLSFRPDKFIAAGPAFVAAALAAFGVEHFVAARTIMQIVPSWVARPAWVPLRPLWGYLMGALVEAMNYVADTLLFAGTVCLLAQSQP